LALSLLDTTTDAGPLLYNAEDMIEKWLIRREYFFLKFTETTVDVLCLVLWKV